MSRRRVALVLCLLLRATIGLPVAAGSVETGATTTDRLATDSVPSTDADDLACPQPTGVEAAADAPRILELYPNPTNRGNVGEYLVLDVPPETALENLTITDGHTVAQLPNETADGRLAVTAAPEETRELTDDPIVELAGTLRLAVDGDDLELLDEGETVDTVSYDRAPTAERWYRTSGSDRENATAEVHGRGEWWPRGASCLPVPTATPREATAFVLPDAPELPRETIRDADDRLLLAGYTITDEDVAAELVAAAERGVDVSILFESGPVGGTPAPTDAVLAELERGGVDVRAVGGEGARYRFHHPNYAVADDSVLVTTENWNPSGVGGQSSRCWGVAVDDGALAADLADVFETDFEGWDTRTGATFRAETSFVEDDPREFETAHEPTTVPVESAELLLAPENAESRIETLLADADDEILVKQASIASDVSLLYATIEAAKRGDEVRLLLDSIWYVEAENKALVDDLEQTAADESLPLEARLVDDTDEFEKIHAKGIVVDRETAVVGSANWNDNSLQHNREVLLAVHSPDAAAYYAAVFDSDWEGQRWSLPIELSAAVVVALLFAALVGARYVRFGTE
jgi:cardiolipin synthase A/B